MRARPWLGIAYDGFHWYVFSGFLFRRTPIEVGLPMNTEGGPNLFPTHNTELYHSFENGHRGSAAAVGDDDWEWYVILTLWSPLQVSFQIYSTAEEIVKCWAPRGLVQTVLLENRTLLGSRKWTYQ